MLFGTHWPFPGSLSFTLTWGCSGTLASLRSLTGSICSFSDLYQTCHNELIRSLVRGQDRAKRGRRPHDVLELVSQVLTASFYKRLLSASRL